MLTLRPCAEVARNEACSIGISHWNNWCASLESLLRKDKCRQHLQDAQAVSYLASFYWFCS